MRKLLASLLVLAALPSAYGQSTDRDAGFKSAVGAASAAISKSFADKSDRSASIPAKPRPAKASPAKAEEKYPQLKGCEAALKKELGWTLRGSDGDVATGYMRGGPSLVLLTENAAYYYHEDCDICAEVTACDLKTHQISSAAYGHMVSCSDMKRYETGKIEYNACPIR